MLGVGAKIGFALALVAALFAGTFFWLWQSQLEKTEALIDERAKIEVRAKVAETRIEFMKKDMEEMQHDIDTLNEQLSDEKQKGQQNLAEINLLRRDIDRAAQKSAVSAGLITEQRLSRRLCELYKASGGNSGSSKACAVSSGDAGTTGADKTGSAGGDT